MEKTDYAKRDEAVTDYAIDSLNRKIISREEVLIILSEIATGKSDKVSISDSIEAIRVLSNIQGWNTSNDMDIMIKWD
ncbi:hypothetical protein EZS27_016133 [termite gut metagenome]|uniref:Uncharacterized protein n=1 Tax=termite gut metagenome TaxID=433724 RepID=A0A5J4RRB6_9ZZZZ